MAAGGRVKQISTDSEFQKELISAGNALVVADFFATWCQPCKEMAPKFLRLSEKFPKVIFLKVDVDICRNTAKRYEVQSMPTFLFFKKREKLHKVMGADEAGLEAGVLQHMGTDSSKDDAETCGVTVPGQMNLISLLDRSMCECLNESDDHPFTDALSSPGSDKYLESDCDEQLIISLGFIQPVKLHSIQLTGPSDGRAPRDVKLFINQPQSIDFDKAEQMKPHQELSLSEEDVLEDSVIPLAFVKFQHVQNLTIFIKNNQGDEETTVVNLISLHGSNLDSTNMKEFKRVAGDKGERHA